MNIYKKAFSRSNSFQLIYNLKMGTRWEGKALDDILWDFGIDYKSHIIKLKRFKDVDYELYAGVYHISFSEWFMLRRIIELYAPYNNVLVQLPIFRSFFNKDSIEIPRTLEDIVLGNTIFSEPEKGYRGQATHLFFIEETKVYVSIHLSFKNDDIPSELVNC
ncbi:hypothetical protein D5F52_26810 (plasmid) [Brevibacillus laterosporus]|uniref:hypothetical protein n=1 Tax=Brevibacillus laterosporus TaxID=1465 RepID=UPI000E6C0AA7|nr:hypothetical protein [Brevibacillus laterosporus]AYB41767.1 hypothetical protein D5F52_26810 [Brevibacillus laterosporus]